MTKFRDYNVEDTIESVVRLLARAEQHNSISETFLCMCSLHRDAWQILQLLWL